MHSVSVRYDAEAATVAVRIDDDREDRPPLLGLVPPPPLLLAPHAGDYAVIGDGAALGFAAASDAPLAVRVRDVRFGATPSH